MARVKVQEAATHRIDEIYRYTLKLWGERQAEAYIEGLFDAFARIKEHGVHSRPVPADFGVNGFFFRYEKHFVYWRHLSNGDIGIVTILHERMHQIGHFRDDGG